MPTLNINDETLYRGYFTLNKQENTLLTLSTRDLYVDRDIDIYMSARGSIVNLSATASANISNLTYTYNSTNNNFDITGNANLSGTAVLAVSQTGWINNTVYNTVNGTTQLKNVTVPKVTVGATINGTAKVKPVISRTSTTTTSGTAVNVGSSTATTTAPSSGFFVSVQSAAKNNNIYAIPNVSSAGYGTTSYYTSTTASLSIGAKASDITYIPITTGVAAADNASADVTLYTTDGNNNGVNISAILGTKATTEPTSGYYLAFTASGSGNSKVTTAGWFQTGSLTTASTTSGAKYYPVATAVYSVTGGGLTASTGYASISSNGYYNGSSYDTTDKVDITSQTSQASGYYKITASGYGKVNRAAINRQATTAGYLPIDSSAIQVSAATNLNSNTGTQAYYIKKSVLSTNTYNSSNLDQTITIPAGYAPERTITINKMATVTATTSYSNSGLNTYFNTGTSSNYNVSITPQYSNSAGYMAAHTNANNGGIGYLKIKTTSTTGGNSVKATTATVTRGTFTWGTGWITSGSLTPAMFSNIPLSGVTYLDVTGTSTMPVLDSGGKLYINKGYVDNLVVDLGQFIPEEANISSSNELINGASGINSNGDLIVGNLLPYTSANLVATGNTVIVPGNGYFLSTASCAVASGDYSSGVTLSAVTVTPSVSINNASTYGFTTTKPSGTNGTNFLTIDPGANAPTYSATGTASITTAGYITTGNKKSNTSATVKVAAGQNYYVPVVSPSFIGGTLSGSTTNTITVTGMNTSASATSYYIDAKAVGTATRAITQYSNGAGVMAAHTNATVIAAAGLNVGSSATRTYIPAAAGSVTITGGSGACTYSTATNANCSTTNNSGVEITFTGGGTVTAVAKITTAGYTPTNNNFATATAGSGNGVGSIYVNGVTLTPPNSGTRYFDITVPNGSVNDYMTFRFTVDTSGNVTIGPPPGS